MPLRADEQDALRRRCTIVVSGHGEEPPGAELARLAEWCRQHGWHADRYGEGALIGAFEARVAALLGKPAAVFMPSGTMAQQIALRIACERANNFTIAMHPTSHLELHEERAYARLHSLRATLLGERERPTSARDLGDLAGAETVLSGAVSDARRAGDRRVETSADLARAYVSSFSDPEQGLERLRLLAEEWRNEFDRHGWRADDPAAVFSKNGS